MKSTEKNVKITWAILKCSNIQVFRIPKGKEKENVTEQCLKDNS